MGEAVTRYQMDVIHTRDGWNNDGHSTVPVQEKHGRWVEHCDHKSALRSVEADRDASYEEASKLRARLAEVERQRDAMRGEMEHERARGDCLSSGVLDALNIAGCDEGEMPSLLLGLRARAERLERERDKEREAHEYCGNEWRKASITAGIERGCAKRLADALRDIGESPCPSCDKHEQARAALADAPEQQDEVPK